MQIMKEGEPRTPKKERSSLLPTKSQGTKEDWSNLPLFGEILALSTICVCTFTLIVCFRIAQFMSWSYWLVFFPLWILLFGLLVLTQSKRVTKGFSLIVRLAWLMCVVCFVAFLVMLCLHLDKNLLANKYITYNALMIPLWSLLGIMFLLGGSGLFVCCCDRQADEQRRNKYFRAGCPLIVFVLATGPFFLLLELKLEEFDLNWDIVFIPLWIADAFSLLIGCVLLIFTVGSRDSAVFGLSQVITFLLMVVASTVFKILLVKLLEGSDISIFYVCIPIVVLQLLCIFCGLQVRFWNGFKYTEEVHSLENQKLTV